MSLGKARAKQVLRELNIDSPELLINNLKDICWERGAFVREENLDGAEARLTVANGKGVITVNPNNSYATRSRFSIAHELGHFELHRNEATSLTCDKKDLNNWFQLELSKNQEIEANEFAAELLMPENFVGPDIVQNEPNIALLEKLSEKYQVSLMAASKKFIDLTKEACAIVFFHNGNVDKVWPSLLFQEQKYWIEKGPLDASSYAHDACSGKPIPNYMSQVDVTTWFDVPKWLEEETILEQAKYFTNRNSGMSLLWIKSAKLIRY